jgi:hypothetical protein
MFTQMSARKGIRKLGQVAWDALKKEMQQFRDMDVLEPLDAFKLTEEEKKGAAELIGASNYLPHTLYVKMFMKAQGYPINKATFYQDNESAIKMEQNGKASTGQRSRHIDIHYFFITDYSKRSDITMVHCPTSHMLADFFTKPLQGSLSVSFSPSYSAKSTSLPSVIPANP